MLSYGKGEDARSYANFTRGK